MFVEWPGIPFSSVNACPQSSQTCCDTPFFGERTSLCWASVSISWVALKERGLKVGLFFGAPLMSRTCHLLAVRMFIGGVKLDDSSDGTGDCGFSLSSHWRIVGGTTATVARLLKELDGRFKSFKLGVIIGSCLPWRERKLARLSPNWLSVFWSAGDATVEMVIFYLVCVPESSVDLRISWVLFRFGLCTPDNCSTQKKSESVELKELLLLIFKEMKFTV